MKIIQLITVEDGGIQGLGEDGQLYELIWKVMSFGRHDKQWVLAQGHQTLAQKVASLLPGASKDDVKLRLTNFATRYGLYGNTALSAYEDAVIHTLKGNSDEVTVTQTETMLTVRGSDGSEQFMKLVGGQYV